MIYVLFTILFLLSTCLILRARWIEDLSSTYQCIVFDAKHTQKLKATSSSLQSFEYEDIFFTADQAFWKLFNLSSTVFIKSPFLFHIVINNAVVPRRIYNSFMKSQRRSTKRAYRAFNR